MEDVDLLHPLVFISCENKSTDPLRRIYVDDKTVPYKNVKILYLFHVSFSVLYIPIR